MTARGGGSGERSLSVADRAVAGLAARQRGLVTIAQLGAAGLDEAAVRRRVRRGALHRVHRGVYAVGHAAAVPLGREQAALLACGPEAVLSHWTAARLHAMLRASETAPIDVIVPDWRRIRAEGIRPNRRAMLPDSDVWVREGLRVTTPRRTLLDLAAVASVLELRAAINEAQVRGLVMPQQLVLPPGTRGAARLREALAGHSGPTRSDAERQLVTLIRRAGLPLPELNTRVAGHEVDAVWHDARIVIEVDTYATHGDVEQFVTDRDRDHDLRRAGFTVIRLLAERLEAQPEAVAIDLALAREREAERTTTTSTTPAIR